MSNNVQENIIPLIEVGVGTNEFHRELTEKIVGEFAGFFKSPQSD
jgi:hypothetical protein